MCVTTNPREIKYVTGYLTHAVKDSTYIVSGKDGGGGGLEQLLPIIIVTLEISNELLTNNCSIDLVSVVVFSLDCVHILYMGFSNEIVVDMETGVEIVVGTRVLLEETAIVAKHTKGPRLPNVLNYLRLTCR